MRRLTLRLIPTIALLAAVVARPGAVLGDAIPPEGGGEPGVIEGGIDIGLLSLAVVVGLVVLVATAITLRPAWRSAILAGVVGAVALAVGLFLVVGGLFFFDWTGQHEVRWPAVALGAAVLAGGLVLAVRTARGGRASSRS